MSDRKRILASSIFIMAGGMFSAATIAITILYRTASGEEMAHLMEIASGQARFMQAVARFDAIHSQDAHPDGSEAATLSQIAGAHHHSLGFGETGELVVARREGDQIVFLFPHRHGDGGDPDPVPWTSELAEPMRRALSGKEGTLVALDYRGEPVLAAHVSVAELNFGVVAKRDLAEVRSPFVTAGVFAGAITVLLVLVGAGLTLRSTDPLVRRLALFQRFAGESGHGLAMADLSRRITYTNAATCSLVDADKPEDVLGESFLQFYPEESRKELQEHILPTVIRAGQWTGELTILSKKGRLSPTLGNIFLVRDEKEKPLCFACVMTDITERKRAEVQLRQTKQAAETANKAKSEFLANMSHEIRTPMTAILGFAESLLDPELSQSEQLDTIHTIRRNGEYLLRIINDILDLSKIEAGRLDVENTRCSPLRLVAEAQSLMQVRADTKGLSLEIGSDGAIPETIRTDPTRLRQILVNLLGNAIKFTESGGVRLVTRFVSDAEGDQGGNAKAPRMQFDVVDTGSGMTERQVAGLFQPFTQADTSTTRRSGGTGLGLAISKRFAEMLGGDITVVETQEGIGTRFRVTVTTGSLDGVRMLEHPMSATVVATDADRTAGSSDQSDLHGCRILLAEDGPDNQQIIALILKKAGADVTVVENGKLAAEAALEARDKGQPFDVILMDMQMPVTDGYQATTLLRQKGYTGPIIALTAHAMEGDQEKCINAGCDEYASKPIYRKKLIEMIRVHTSHAASTA